MAANENSTSGTIKRTCNYCKKPVNTGVCCDTCHTIYHNSCAKKAKLCCETTPATKYQAPDPDLETLSEISYLKEENKLLRQIIMDKDTIISDKDMLIALLNEKFTLFENGSHSRSKQPPINQPESFTSVHSNLLQLNKHTKKEETNIEQASLKVVNKGKKSSKNATKETILIQDIQQRNTTLKNSPDFQQLSEQTLGKCDEIIHLNDDVGGSHHNSFSENHSKFLRKDKKINSSPSLPIKSYGTGQASTLLTVAPKRNWIWIGGLDQRTTLENVKQYVKDIFPGKNIDCFDLKSKFKKKCFKIGCFDLSMDDLLDPKNWPSKLSIRPFRHQ